MLRNWVNRNYIREIPPKGVTGDVNQYLSYSVLKSYVTARMVKR